VARRRPGRGWPGLTGLGTVPFFEKEREKRERKNKGKREKEERNWGGFTVRRGEF